MTAQRALDHVQSLAALDAFDAAPYLAALAAELPADLEAGDAALAAALAAIDALAVRAMRIRLEHAGTALAAPTQRVFVHTVVSYAQDLGLLAERVRRVSPPDEAAVVAAARTTLALRETLRTGVLTLVRDRAATAIADADRRARDRTLDEPQRRRWSAVRRDLEALVADPARVAVPMPTRLAAMPAQLDEPEPEPELPLAALIELD